jgi:hypothetical protein
MEKIVIGQSDYPRKAIEENKCGWTLGSTTTFLETIKLLEENGYTIKFETSLFRRLFALGIYKIIAYKIKENV